MNIVLARLLAPILVLGVLAAPAAARAEVYGAETFTLDNGMQVVVVSNHRVPVVTHMVWYRVGAADEPPGHTGMAHLLEHLMFKGTEEVAPGEFSRRVAEIGGRDNAFTSHDFTAYYQTVAKQHLDMVMRMEADRMTNLLFEDEHVRTERQVVLEERRQRTDNNPSALLGERANAVMFHNHPYRTPVIGWAGEVATLERDTLMAFYRRHYAPDNAILVVSGDVTTDEVRALAEEHYGPIPARQVAARARPVEPEPVVERRVVLRHPQVQQPSWSRRYLAPTYTTGASEHAHALEVLSEVIGGGTTSQLYRRLVVEEELAAGAGAGYSPEQLDYGTFYVWASPRPGVDMEALEAAVTDELEAIRRNGVDAAEVERAKTRLRANVIYARDSTSRGAFALGRALTTGSTVEDVETWPESIAAVTPEDVDAAARAVLAEHRAVTALLLPRPQDVAADDQEALR